MAIGCFSVWLCLKLHLISEGLAYRFIRNILFSLTKKEFRLNSEAEDRYCCAGGQILFSILLLEILSTSLAVQQNKSTYFKEVLYIQVTEYSVLTVTRTRWILWSIYLHCVSSAIGDFMCVAEWNHKEVPHSLPPCNKLSYIAPSFGPTVLVSTLSPWEKTESCCLTM